MFEIVAYRWSDFDRPFRGTHTGDSRYQRPGEEPTQYWAMHPLGPWAEFLRSQFIGAPPTLDNVHHRIWAGRFAFEDDELLDVTYEWARDSGRVAPEDLVADDFTGCQLLAEWARDEYVGLRVPSAALPGTKNLVLFGSRQASPYQLEPIDRDIDIPTSVVAERGRPPVQLASYVRFQGQPHPELEAWLDDRQYEAPAQLGVLPATPTF